MRTWYKSIAVFLSIFMPLMHPLALMATEVGTSTSPNSSVISQIPSNFLFTENMYNGKDSDQVRMLQIFLNSDSQTTVTTSGPGGSGHETTYFGNATQKAVEKFQTIYKSIILEPLGFSSPTGIIGARTRSVMNQILDNLRKGLPTNTNIYIGRAVQNIGSSTSGTADNNLLFQSVNSGTTSLVQATSTGTSTPLVILTNTIPSAIIGTYYTATIEASGGRDSYGWGVLYGSLPNGITARAATCISSPCKAPLTLSGTPTGAGSFTFIIRLTSGSDYVTKEMIINIQDRSKVTTTTTNNNTSSTNTTNYTPSTNASTGSSVSSSNTSSSSSNLGLAAGIVGAALVVGALSNSSSESGSSNSGGSSSGGGGTRTVFGGKIGYVQYCTCSTFILLFIYDFDLKSVIQLLYVPGVSRLFQAYNVFQAGPQVLGGYIQGSTPCLINTGDGCVQIGAPIGMIDFLRGVGTTAQ